MNQRLMQGQSVFDSDGNELGSVKEVRGAYFKVDAPMRPDYWLRTDAITSSMGDGLTVMADAPHYDNAGADADVDASTERVAGTGTTTAAYTESTGKTSRTRKERRPARDDVGTADSDRTLELREERLRVDKERERAGEVRIGKRVTEHTESVDVPLREERVVVERRPGSGRATGEISETDEEIEVPLTRERAVVDKEAVVREEVTARKDVTERSDTVDATLRREELDIDGDGDIVADGDNLNAPRTPAYEHERTRRD